MNEVCSEHAHNSWHAATDTSLLLTVLKEAQPYRYLTSKISVMKHPCDQIEGGALEPCSIASFIGPEGANGAKLAHFTVSNR